MPKSLGRSLLIVLLGLLLVVVWATPYLATSYLTRHPDWAPRQLSQLLQKDIGVAAIHAEWQLRGLFLEGRGLVIKDALGEGSGSLLVTNINFDVDVLESLKKRRLCLEAIFAEGLQWQKPEAGTAAAGLLKSIEVDLADEKLPTFSGNVIMAGDSENAVAFAGRLLGPNLSAGEIVLTGDAVRLLAVPYLREAIPDSQLEARVHWQVDAEEGVRLQVPHLHLSNPQFAVDLSGKLHARTDESATVALTVASGNDMQVSALKSLLPYPLMDQELASWLQDALLAGAIAQSRTQLQIDKTALGWDVDGMKLDSQIEVKDLQLKFDPDWGPILLKRGKITLTEKGLAADSMIGHAHGLNLRAGQATLAFDDHPPVLVVKAEVTGSSAAVKRYLRGSPLDNKMAALFETVDLQGPLVLHLGLRMPLDTGEPQIASRLILKQNHVLLKKTGHRLDGVTGVVAIDDHLISGRQLQASYKGLGFRADLHVPVADDSPQMVRIDLEGSAQAQPLVAALPLLAAIDLQGSVQAHASLTMVDHPDGLQISLEAQSPLQNTLFRIPGLYHKAALGAKPLSLHLQIDDKVAIKAQLGRDLKVDVTGGDGWQGYISAARAVAGLPKPQPQTLYLHTAETRGHILIKNHPGSLRPATIKADIRRLNMQTPESANVSPDSVAAGQRTDALPSLSSNNGEALEAVVAHLPRIDMVCQQCTFDDISFDDMQFTLHPQGKELHLRNVSLRKDDAFHLKLEAGSLSVQPVGLSMHGKGQLEVVDLGELLSVLVIPTDLTGLKGQVMFDLTYTGPWSDISRPNLSGTLGVILTEGTVRKSGRNLTKLLDAITLNLKEALSERTRVHYVKANFDIKEGMMHTDACFVALSSLLLKYSGGIDLRGRLYRGQMRVYLNADNAIRSLAAFFVNPLLGVSFVGSSSPKTAETFLNKLVSSTFKVHGLWEDPKISWWSR